MAQKRDADATRKRILDAASVEFAAFGIAGARVDRIAENAHANKAMIYRYFGGKDALFDEVFTAHVVAFVDAVRFDADDLPAFAGRLFDSYQDNPMTLRLTHWYQLERPEGAPLQALVASNAAKLTGIADAQMRGKVPTRFTPMAVLALVRGVAMAWHNLTPELGNEITGSHEERRASVVDGTSRMLSA